MPSSIRNRPAALGLLGLCVVGLLLVALTQGSFASTSMPNGSGTLEVGGAVYEYATETCSITNDGFVASGHGMVDDQQFWISGSNKRIDIAIGTDSVAEAPGDDDFWLASFDEIQWQAEDLQLSAAFNMQDDRIGNPAPYQATLAVSCNPPS